MAGKQAGLGSGFYVGGYDLSGDVSALGKISTPFSTLDFTAIKNTAYVRQLALRDGGMDFTTFLNAPKAVSSPGVPATTVPLVSTYADPVLVTVIGGTGTNVSINGVLQGTFDGTYLLPANGTIILTYTVAPTWAWTLVGGAHTVLSALPRTDTIMTFAVGNNGTIAVGSPAACLNSKQVSYDWSRGNDASLSGSVSGVGNGFGLEWGIQLTPGLRTDLVATTGAFYDLGAVPAYTNGAQAYLQLVALTGTSVDVAVTHCATSGGSYTPLIDFGAQAAIGSFRGTSAGTVNEFVKVATTGTFTYAKFNVVLVPNIVAARF